jgi:hypothetical protein
MNGAWDFGPRIKFKSLYFILVDGTEGKLVINIIYDSTALERCTVLETRG